MKDLAIALGAWVFATVFIVGALVGLFCGLAAIEQCGNHIGPGATESWIGACAEHKSLAECVHDAAIMGCR